MKGIRCCHGFLDFLEDVERGIDTPWRCIGTVRGSGGAIAKVLDKRNGSDGCSVPSAKRVMGFHSISYYH
jgi:hypothetical protein